MIHAGLCLELVDMKQPSGQLSGDRALSKETSELLDVHGSDKCVICSGTHTCTMHNNGKITSPSCQATERSRKLFSFVVQHAET